MAVLAAGALLGVVCVGPAAADNIRDGQWPLGKYAAARDVWPVSTGEGVIVAVIDSGVVDHQDLTGQLLPGADFSGGNSSGKDDATGHGTGMASIIAGHGHGAGSGSGIMGLAPHAKILPIKVGLTEDGNIGSGPETKIADAIRFAVDKGAKVVNMSIAGSLGHDDAAREAVKYAVSKDVVLVAGVGNLGDVNSPVLYPAAFPGVVAVGAIDQSGALWSKSNRGPEVTLVAPGVDVYRATAQSAGSYGKGTGTSDSTAYVSAIAALIRAKYPQLSAGQVINRMISSAVAPPDKSAVPNTGYGYGIASPSKALAANPAVDNGPRDNPLLARTEAQGAPEATNSPSAAASAPGSATPAPDRTQQPTAKAASGGIPGYVYGVGGAVVLLAVVGVVLVVRRRQG